MTSHILEHIRALQRQGRGKEAVQRALEHNPEMLLIGCIDARLDPIRDIGIPHGKALIHRVMAALITGKSYSESATLEFAINERKVTDVVVMGHTYCGGIMACLQEGDPSEHPYIHRYLSALDHVRDDVREGGGNIDQQARAMEQAAVRESVANIMSYEMVAEAVARGDLKVHGWVIDTATGRINEMDARGNFAPME